MTAGSRAGRSGGGGSGEDDRIELWPVPDQDARTGVGDDGSIKVVGIRNLRPFRDETDVCDLDDRLIVLYAAAELLAAAGAKDAQLKLQQAAARYAKLKGDLTPGGACRCSLSAPSAPRCAACRWSTTARRASNGHDLDPRVHGRPRHPQAGRNLEGRHARPGGRRPHQPGRRVRAARRLRAGLHPAEGHRGARLHQGRADRLRLDPRPGRAQRGELPAPPAPGRRDPS